MSYHERERRHHKKYKPDTYGTENRIEIVSEIFGNNMRSKGDSSNFLPSVVDSIFNNIITRSSIILFTLTTDLTVRGCNRIALEKLGYTDEELRGQSINALLSGISPLIEADIEELDKKGKLYKTKKDIIKRDGSLLSASISCTAIRDNQTNIQGYVFTAMDLMPEVKARIRRQLKREKVIQSQKMEALMTLSAGIAHEFNNLFAIISGYINLLRGAFDDNPAALKKFDNINYSISRATGLTHQLLGYSGKSASRKVWGDINTVTKDVIKLFSDNYTNNIEFKVNLTKSLWLTEIDIDQLSEALIGLICNACEAMQENAILQIKTKNIVANKKYCKFHKPLIPGDYVRISIIDNGTGISKEIIDKIYDPFFTTKDTGVAHGLGLSMVQGVMRHHNGFITIHTKVNEGTRFDLYFPAVSRSQSKRGQGLSSTLVEKQNSKKTIIIVEKSVITRDLFNISLSGTGARLLFVTDDKEALAIYEISHKDVDLVVFNMDSFTKPIVKVCRQMHKINKNVNLLFFGEFTDNNEISNLNIKHDVFVTEGMADLDKLLNYIVEVI